MNYVILFQCYVRVKAICIHTFRHKLKPDVMPILTILIVLVVTGVVLCLVNAYIPMDIKIKRILNIVVVVFIILFLLRAFGVLDFLSSVKV